MLDIDATSQKVFIGEGDLTLHLTYHFTYQLAT